MFRYTALLAILAATPSAHAEGIGQITLEYQNGRYGGPDANVSGEDATEAETFGLLGLDGSWYNTLSGAWSYQVNAQYYDNIDKDERQIEDAPAGFTRNDNHMSYGLLELHLANRGADRGWGGFAGLWAGELDDGEPGLPINIDEAEKYYLGVEGFKSYGATDLFAQIGFTDTIGSDYSNIPSEGTDFRQIRDGVFLTVGGNHYASDAMVLSGRLAALFGKSSDSSSQIRSVDFTGLNAEFGVEYQPSSHPYSLSGGVGYSYGEFSGSNSDNEQVNSAYVYVGLTYWFGGDSAVNNRRKMLPTRAADFLVSAESMAIGNLN